jgi:branched-chain amino acid transport system ATP-binding protein
MLRIENLRAGYGGSDALYSVSLKAERGTIVSIVGANGAGKSTLINAISRLVAVNSGSIFFENEDISRFDPPQAVARGIVQSPEGRQLFGPLSVEDNLRLGFHRLAGKKGADRLYRVRRDYVHSLFPRLAERAEQRSGSLSGGEQQMLAIGRALMADPKLLLLDEPSLGLAPMIVERIFEVLALLRKEGLTILLVEQHADDALRLADYGYVLAVGRVRAEGRGDVLRKDPAVLQSYLGKVSSGA